MIFDASLSLHDLESSYNIACRRTLPTRQPSSFSRNLIYSPWGESFDYAGYRFTVWKWIDGGSRESRFSGETAGETPVSASLPKRNVAENARKTE